MGASDLRPTWFLAIEDMRRNLAVAVAEIERLRESGVEMDGAVLYLKRLVERMPLELDITFAVAPDTAEELDEM